MNTQSRLIYGVSFICLVLVLAASWFGLAARGQTDRSNDGGRWEYLIVGGGRASLSPMGGPVGKTKQKVFQNEATTVERNLDQLGDDGWILVSVVGSSNDPTFFLKRPTDKR